MGIALKSQGGRRIPGAAKGLVWKAGGKPQGTILDLFHPRKSVHPRFRGSGSGSGVAFQVPHATGPQPHPAFFHGGLQLPGDTMDPSLWPHKVALRPTPAPGSARWAEGPGEPLASPQSWLPRPSGWPWALRSGLVEEETQMHAQRTQAFSPGTPILGHALLPTQTPNTLDPDILQEHVWQSQDRPEGSSLLVPSRHSVHPGRHRNLCPRTHAQSCLLKSDSLPLILSRDPHLPQPPFPRHLCRPPSLPYRGDQIRHWKRWGFVRVQRG